MMNDTTVYLLMQDVGLGNDTPICQYMELEHLKTLLNSSNYFVNRKCRFSDMREKSFPFKLQFAITPAKCDRPTIPQPDRQIEITEAAKRFRDSANLLTSCWTERITENVLWWERYKEDAACIISNIWCFTSSFKNIGNYTIWCGKMLYEPIQPVLLSDDIIWYKEPYFSDEREVRFYFSKSFAKVSAGDNVESDHEDFEVDLGTLIQGIVLSPKVEKETMQEIEDMVNRLGLNVHVKPSKIELS